MKIKHIRHGLSTIEDEIERIIEDICRRSTATPNNITSLWSLEVDIVDAIQDEIVECEVRQIEVTYGVSGLYVVLTYKIAGFKKIEIFKTLIHKK